MDFNILIPSIAKTLDMQAGTKEQLQLLGRRLMNVLAEVKHKHKSLDEAQALHKQATDKIIATTKTLAIADKVIIELTKSTSLSDEERLKNMVVISPHIVKIDYENDRVIYPIGSPMPPKSPEFPQ